MKPYRSIWTYLFKTAHRIDYVVAAGIRTRYLEAGHPGAPPVILLHGTGGSLENFAANIAAYAEHFRVLAIDLVGCGWTDKPDHPYSASFCAQHVKAFMDVIGIQRASFVGVSLGSWIAVRLAADFPDRADRIVMVAPAGIVPDKPAFDAYVAGMRERRTKAAGAPTWDSIRTVFNALLLDPDDVIDDLIAVRLQIYQDPAMPQAMAHIMAIVTGQDYLQEQAWRAFPNPILAIKALDHVDMFQVNADKIAEYAPDATVVGMTGCNHWAQFEQPDRFNAVSIPFLLGEPIPSLEPEATVR